MAAGQPLARVNLERSTDQHATPSAVLLASVDRQDKLTSSQAATELANKTYERARLSAAVLEAKRKIAEIKASQALQRQIVASSRSTFEPLTSVLNKGFVSRFQYEERHQQLLAQEQQLSGLNEQLSDAQSNLMRQQEDLADLDDVTQSKLQNLDIARESLKQKKIGIEAEASYLVTAPSAGRVATILVDSDANIGADGPIMTIMPADQRLQAELYVPNKSIGLVREGQEVRLKFEAFPYQKYGTGTGHVRTVSQAVIGGMDAVAAGQANQNREPVYRLFVDLDHQVIGPSGASVALRPGMTLQGQIIVDRSSFFDWFLSAIFSRGEG